MAKGKLKKGDKVHLIGIGGTGMSGLACLLQDKGFIVQGSDICQNSRIKNLRKRKIKVFLNQTQNNITSDLNLVCYSSAVSPVNPELKAAASKKIKIVKRGKLLAQLCRNTKVIAVAGSHGKTTVVSLLNYILKKMGYKPTVFIGGLPVDGSLPAAWGSQYSIIETDESDGTFLQYRPYLSVITNIDHEHMNFYKKFTNLKKSFLDFAKKTEKKVIGCYDCRQVKAILKQTKGVSYGLGPGAEFRAENIRLSSGFMLFDFYLRGEFLFSLKSSLAGRHNCLNILACLAVIDSLAIDLRQLKQYLPHFEGIKRRFQLVAETGQVKFIDDYGHHPSEIEATLEGACLFRPKRIFAILQPHRPSRVNHLFDRFCGCLKKADLAVVTDIYLASEKESKVITAQQLVKGMISKGCKQVFYLPKAELAAKIPAMIKKGDMVIAFGAGDINQKLGKIIYEFKRSKREKEG